MNPKHTNAIAYLLLPPILAGLLLACSLNLTDVDDEPLPARATAVVPTGQVLMLMSELTPSIYLPLVLSSLPLSLGQVNDFLYQLQNLDLTGIGDTAYDLVVMDYSADGSESGEITAEFASGRDTDFSRAEIAAGAWAGYSGQGQGDLTDDPLFVGGWPQPDLRLQPGSPAINAGTADGAPAEDVDGLPRGAQSDLGAYE